MVIKEITNRRSIRSYKKIRPSKDLIIELIKAAQFAPNFHHNRSWEFIVVTDNRTKKQFYELLGKNCLLEAPIIIVPLIDATQSTSPTEDISVASENIFIQATYLGLGTVWNNIRKPKDRKEIKKILKIPKKFMLINLIPVGYPKTVRRAHLETDFDPKKIHKETF